MKNKLFNVLFRANTSSGKLYFEKKTTKIPNLDKKSNFNVIDDGCKKTQGRSLITCDLTKEGKKSAEEGFFVANQITNCPVKDAFETII